MDEQFYHKLIESNKEEAEKLINDKDKMEIFLERIEEKLKLIPRIGDLLSDIPMLISLIRAYIKKEYRDIPLGSIIAAVVGLIYFWSPIDISPDILPGVGYLDDAAVIAGIIKLIHEDVQNYRLWKQQNGK